MGFVKDLWFLYSPTSLFSKREIKYFYGYKDGGYTSCTWKMYFSNGKLVLGTPI